MMKTKQSFAKIKSLAEERLMVAHEVEVFEMLRGREESAIKSRIEEVREAVQHEKDRNQRLQNRFKDLKRAEKMLDAKLA